MTFLSPTSSWRSLNLSKRSRFHHPKKVTARITRKLWIWSKLFSGWWFDGYLLIFLAGDGEDSSYRHVEAYFCEWRWGWFNISEPRDYMTSRSNLDPFCWHAKGKTVWQHLPTFKNATKDTKDDLCWTDLQKRSPFPLETTDLGQSIWNNQLGGGNSNIFLFSTLFGEDEPILTITFFRWVGSTTN